VNSPGFRKPRAIFQNGVEHELGRQESAVTGNLDGVFARERARRTQDGEQNFVHSFAVPDNLAVMDRVRRRGGRFQRTLSRRQKNLVRNRKRFRAGNADDSKPPSPSGVAMAAMVSSKFI